MGPRVRLWASLCYVCMPFSGLLGRRHKRPFVRYHAWQAWYLGWAYIGGLLIVLCLDAVVPMMMSTMDGMDDVVLRSFVLGSIALWIWTVWRIQEGYQGGVPFVSRRARKRSGFLAKE